MNTTQLTCFLAVSDFLNFSKAAERLQMTQPAVSHQIRTLEDELKVKLFYRTSKQVRLTDAGRIFLSDARQMVDIAHRARRRFEAADRVEPELLSLGCDNFAGMYLFQDTLQQLHRERPALRPRLEVIPFQYIYRLLVDDVLDAVIGFQEPSTERTNFLYQELIRSPIVCICPEEHPLAEREQVTMTELQSEPLVLFLPPRTAPSMLRIQGQLMGDRPPSAFCFCESVEAITILVGAGFGVSVLPEILVPETDTLKKIPMAHPEMVSIGIHYKSLQGRPALRAFVQTAKQQFARNGPGGQ